MKSEKNSAKRTIAFAKSTPEEVQKIYDIFFNTDDDNATELNDVIATANTEILIKIFSERLEQYANLSYEIFLFDNVEMSVNTQKFVAQVYIELMNYISLLENCSYAEAIKRFEEYTLKEI